MAQTLSNMIPLGTFAPDFSLVDVISNKVINLSETKGNTGTLIMFICNHCPFVKYINHELVNIANDFPKKGIQIIAINSNDVENFPEDDPKLMKELAEKEGFSFPYLYDESQEVAKLYDAACTPDFYLFNSDLKLIYRGQLDDSRPGNEIPVTGKDLRLAIENLINNKPQVEIQKPSIGCNIKWKS